MTAQAWFETNSVGVEPGTSVVLPLTVTNLGARTDSFSLTPTGLAAPWATVRPAYVTLFGGAQATVEVVVDAPRLPSTTAGSVALGVRVVSQQQPDDVELSEMTLEVQPTFDRRITMLQPAMRTRRRARFELLVENLGNTQANCQMHLIEPTTRIDGRFDPPGVGVEPGGSSLVRLKVAATRLQWERRSRSIPFRVHADQQGAPTASASGTLVQAPVLPDRIGARTVGALAAAGLIVLAWFAVVEPAIDDAAVRAVGDREPAVVTTVDPDADPDTPAPTTVAPDPGTDDPATTPGEPFSTVLPSGSAPGTTSTQAFTVPDGQTLLVTDYLVQNPFGDEGVARLRIGERELQWDLAVHLDGVDVGNRFNTPLQVPAGQQVVFEVECGGIGRIGGTGCSATALVNGRLADATGG